EPNEAIAHMNAWINRALEIDRENGRAWALLALLEYGQGNQGASVTMSGLRAVRFAPRFTGSHVALSVGLSSSFLSLQATREAARLDPLYLYPPTMSAGSLATLGRTEEALAENERALEIEPDLSIALLNKVGFLHKLGRLEEATEVLNRLQPMVAEGRVNAGWFQGLSDENVLLRSEPGEAKEELHRLLALASGELPVPYWQMFAHASIDKLGGRGRIAEAKELLLRLDQAGIVEEYDGLALSPDKGWVREEPSLEPIVQKSKEKFEATMAILMDARAKGELPAYLEAPLDELRSRLGYDEP
ncbi:MAG TPA: hypothetical protein VEK15_23920, partial [Vicinamibacteria bacterium]|nr:hypothetical protein [Vicinamibacteria bacterium]